MPGKSISKLIQKFNGLSVIYPFLLSLIYLLIISFITKDFHELTCDMAEYLNNPVRILNGDLPYRDFWLLFSPGEVYFPALIYKLFGVNIDAVLFTTIISSCLTGASIVLLAKELNFSNTVSFFLSLLFFYSSILYNYEGPQYIHLYLLFIIVSAIFLLKYFRINSIPFNPTFTKGEGRLIFLFFSGLSLGIGFFFRLYEVGGAFVAFLICIVIYFIFNKILFKAAFKQILVFFAGAFIVLLITACTFYSILPGMFTELMFESLSNGTSMNLPYFFTSDRYLSSIIADINNISSVGFTGIFLFFYHILFYLTYLFFYLSPFISTVILILFIISKPNKTEIIMATLLFLWGIISFPRGLGRSDIAHLAPTVSPLILLFAFFIKYTFKNENKITNYQLSIINRNSIIKHASIISLLLLTIPVLHPCFRILNYYKNPVWRIITEKGTVPFNAKADAQTFDSTLKFIEANTRPNDYIFVTIWDAPPMYVLSGRKNPTYFDSMNDPIIRPSIEKQKKIINDISQKNTKLIIHNPDWGYDDKPEQQFRTACSLLQKFIASSYDLAAKYGKYYIYIRK